MKQYTKIDAAVYRICGDNSQIGSQVRRELKKIAKEAYLMGNSHGAIWECCTNFKQEKVNQAQELKEFGIKL